MRADYFNTWSPRMAYILGYIWADGTIGKHKGIPNKVGFGCVDDDSALLLAIAEELGFKGKIEHSPAVDKPVKHGNYAGRVYRSKPMVRFRLYSVVMVRALIEIHGLAPAKCHVDLPFPDNIPDDLFHHFVRGYFDGDGSVSIRESRNRAQFNLLGTTRFVNAMADRVHAAANISPAVVSKRKSVLLSSASWTSKYDVIGFASWLYRDVDQSFCLARKRAKFEDAIAMLATVKGYRGRTRKNGDRIEFNQFDAKEVWTCSVPGCGRDGVAKGYCYKHWDNLIRQPRKRARRSAARS